MIKKTELIFALIIFGLTSNLFAQNQQENNSIEKVSEDMGSPLPSLKIQTLEDVVLTNEDFKTEGHIFLITINPTCSHCNNLGDLINRNAGLFKHSKVIFMVTPSNARNLDFFMNTAHVGDHPELIVGVDQNKTIEKLNDGGLMPYINIYKNGKLVKKLNGDTVLEDLQKYLP